ncbi:MAG TPA: hypothetical protein VGH87_14540 [Polyangiaceae bacterium]
MKLRVVALVLAVTAIAHADDVPKSTKFGYSPYERESIAMVVKKVGGEIDPSPEGKLIESIDTERFEVFEKRDFLPGFLLWVNALHATSHDGVIRREILQRKGERYSQVLTDETARNLRGLPQVSLVLVVPIRGSAPDRVRVLVVTKDVWSLRLQWDVQLTNGGLQELVLQPAETNLAGTHQTVGANFLYQPLSTALGAYYTIPRIADTHVEVVASANIVLSNVTGAPEGSFGNVGAGESLWNTKTEWAWAANAAWRDDIARVYSNAALAYYHSGAVPEQHAIPFVYDPSKGAWPPNALIPVEYRRVQTQASIAATRSFGWAYKNDFTFSLEAGHAAYRTDDLSRFDPAAVSDFFSKRFVPVSDDRIYPAIEWRSYTTSFSRVTDLESLALQEDVRMGHFVDVKLYPVVNDAATHPPFMGVFAEAGYTIPLRDGILRADVQTTTETAVTSGNVLQGVVDADLYFASPRTPIGRLMFGARLVDRYANYLNTVSYLGADTRLRGYPSSYFVGQNMFAANLEYRSRPFEIWKVQLAGVAFYDVGQAFDDWSNFHPVQDAGFGLRALFPTFDRIVFRADLGFPISQSPLPAGVGPATIFVTFGQAFPLPQLGLTSSSVGSLTSSSTR